MNLQRKCNTDMETVANAGLEDNEEEEEAGSVWCADGLLNLKIVHISNGEDINNSPDAYRDTLDMIPNRDRECIKKETFSIKQEAYEEENCNEVFNINEIKKELCPQNNVIEDVPNISISQSYSLSDISLTLGQLVWAKMVGYPSWPAIVVEDPKTNQFLKVKKTLKKVKGVKKDCEHLHVLFLNYQEEVAWIPKNGISLYKLHPLPRNRPKTDPRNKAIQIANSLVHMSCDERLEKYTELQAMAEPQTSARNPKASHNINKEMFPKLFMDPVVKIQRLESAMLQSLM